MTRHTLTAAAAGAAVALCLTACGSTHQPQSTPLATYQTTQTNQTSSTAPAETSQAESAPAGAGMSGVAAPSRTTPTIPAHPSVLPTRNSGAITLGALPGGVDPNSADAVALAGVKALLASDTTIDADPNATVWRNRVWLTPAFAAQVKNAPPIAGPGAQWQTWASHRAVLHVATALGGDEHPPDTPQAAYRQIVATIAPAGAKGWHGSTETKVVFVALTHTTHGWRIASENG